MELEKRHSLNKENRIKNTAETIGRGAVSISSSPVKGIIMIAIVVIAFVTLINRFEVIQALTYGYVLTPIHKFYEVAMVIFIVVIILNVLFIFGRPHAGYFMENNLRRIGLVNSADEVPKLIKVKQVKGEKKIQSMVFEAYGIPLNVWRDKWEALEATLNLNIFDITQGDNKRRVVIEAISAKHQLPERINWDWKYLNHDDFKLALGVDLLGPVFWDLSLVPHGLIGGSTGSGKTVLMKCLLFQAILKGAKVYIADFKGGVDFNEDAWGGHAEQIITEKTELIACLKKLVDELEARKLLLKANNCEDVKKYNEKTGNELPRLIFSCDEVAAVLDKTGASSEEKKVIAEIEKQLSHIARQGRAFSINLLLGTQRPSAEILTGEIRNNIDYRICGRADDVLSKIILDNTSASEAIPKKAQGRFINGEGKIIQAYWLEI